MQPLFVTAFMEIKLLLRERLVILVGLIFIALTIAASFIGWSTSNTINHAYDLSRPFLAQGASLPPNPFANVSHLSLQRNIGMYFFLIGSLMAIIIGYRSTLRDRLTHVSALVMTRGLSNRQFVVAKSMAVALMLLGILFVSFLCSIVVSSLFPELHLTGTQVLHFAMFYGLSWVYLLTFSLIGVMSGLIAKSQTMALLIPVTLWIIIGFVIPQIISGLEPTALLNPVSITAIDQPRSFFTDIQNIIGPFSFAQNYRIASNTLLEFADSSTRMGTLVGSVFGAMALSVITTIWIASRYRPSEEVSS
jgi:ABC-type transport system involved in multi-copper enzyme maturation permease subunit